MTIAPESIPVVIRADHVAGPAQGHWTYTDYAALPEDGHRYELIDGVLYIAPSPGEAHQNANSNFIMYLRMHIKLGGLGQVYGPPFDVQLPGGPTVQPDVIVVLNANYGIITTAGIVGAPDLVVEIVSPGTATYDRSTKLQAYARAGIPEYWLADPATRTIEILRLAQGNYQPLGIFQGQTLLPSPTIPGLPTPVESFFA